MTRRKVERYEALGDRMYLANVLADWAEALCGVETPRRRSRWSLEGAPWREPTTSPTRPG